MPQEPERQSAPAANGPELVAFWREEIDRYRREFASWEQRVGKIIKRYRDERPERSRANRFNILWSNIQTLGPAIYSQPPKPVVERRFLDRDRLARIASQTLERAISIQIEMGGIDVAADHCKLDYLLGSRAQLWIRYEPEYQESTPQPTETEPAEGAETAAEPERTVSWEKVCTDYVHWSDFAHSPVRVWNEVWWVGRRIWLTLEEGIEEFGDIWKRVPLKKPDGKEAVVFDKADRAPRGEVWEIWDKSKREVTFFAPDLTTQCLKTAPDPLHLQGFWPCPRPLYGTTTNDTLVPVPDYAEYQDQAEEIDELTARIKKIVKAVKIAGGYDASSPELAKLLMDTTDNKLVPVTNWAVMKESGGVRGGVSLLPVQEIAGVLVSLYEAREAAKRDLYEITGMSDIIRGQASGAARTATEQRIKGQFASLRLDDRRKAMARFLKDAVAIIGEIVAEQFSPETIITMTGMLDNVMAELPPPAPPPQQPGAPPMPPPDPAMIQQQQMQMAMEIIGRALQLLKDDKMRTFRIDIETDSTVEADQVMEKEAVVEFMGAMAQFMGQALPVAQSAPPLIKPLAEAMMHAMRRFKMGRSVEASFEQALEQLENAAKQPQQGGDPAAEADAQAAQTKAKVAQITAESDVQVAQIKAAADIQKMQMQSQVDQAELLAKAAKLKLDMEQMELDRQRMQAEHSAKMQKIAMDAMTPSTNGAGNA